MLFSIPNKEDSLMRTAIPRRFGALFLCLALCLGLLPTAALAADGDITENSIEAEVQTAFG